VEWVQITAKTLDEARDRALDTLGVDEQDIEIIVLEEPRSGLFGRTKGQAQIRARIRPAPVRPKVERRERRGRKGDQKGKGRSGSNGGGAAGTPGARADDTTSADDSPDDSSDETTVGAAGSADALDGERSEAARPRRRRGGRGSGNSRSQDRDDTGSDRGEEGATMPDLTIDEQASVVSEFLLGLADRFGATGSTTETERVDDETVEISLHGEELGLLIGPKGQTLYLVQELARTAVQRRGGGVHEGRVRIDIAGYRKKRNEALARFTEQVAADVLASGSPKALEPMNAADRKVVHDTANGIDGVRTTSEGEDPRRRVVILPDD
jgi:spoIIIJ-associated protein